MMDHLSKIQKLNISTNLAIMKKISRLPITDYFQSIGMKLKTAMIPMRLVNSFLIYITQFMIYIYDTKGFRKIKNKAYSKSLDNKKDCQIF